MTGNAQLLIRSRAFISKRTIDLEKTCYLNKKQISCQENLISINISNTIQKVKYIHRVHTDLSKAIMKSSNNLCYSTNTANHFFQCFSDNHRSNDNYMCIMVHVIRKSP